MKQLMLQTDVDDKVITTTKTIWVDVIGEMDIVLAVGRNTRKTYLVKFVDGKAIVYAPLFWGKICGEFEHLWELQHFYDLFTFKSFTSIESYMEQNSLAWGEGGN